MRRPQPMLRLQENTLATTSRMKNLNSPALGINQRSSLGGNAYSSKQINKTPWKGAARRTLASENAETSLAALYLILNGSDISGNIVASTIFHYFTL